MSVIPQYKIGIRFLSAVYKILSHVSNEVDRENRNNKCCVTKLRDVGAYIGRYQWRTAWQIRKLLATLDCFRILKSFSVFVWVTSSRLAPFRRHRKPCRLLAQQSKTVKKQANQQDMVCQRCAEKYDELYCQCIPEDSKHSIEEPPFPSYRDNDLGRSIMERNLISFRNQEVTFSNSFMKWSIQSSFTSITSLDKEHWVYLEIEPMLLDASNGDKWDTLLYETRKWYNRQPVKVTRVTLMPKGWYTSCTFFTTSLWPVNCKSIR